MVKKWRSIVFIVPLTLIGVGLFVNSASADDAVFKAVVDEYLSLELDNTHMEVDVLPNMLFASGYVTATVNTNAAAGYTLTFQDTDSRNGLEREGYDEATDKSPFNIPSVSADTTYASLAADSWGYYLGDTTDTEATYKQIPLSATEIKTTDAPAADDASRVNFGVKIADTRPGGAYEDTLTFAAVANVTSLTLEESYAAAGKSKVTINGNQYYTMQDMTPSICSAATAANDTLQVADTRDNTIYHIGKLADDNCWLLDNLALDLTDSTILNNLTASNTNADATALGYLKGTTTRDPSTDPDGNYATAGVANWTSSRSYSAPLVNMASKGTTRADLTNPADTMTEADNWKFGGYYNYCAASAGSYCYGDGTSEGSPSGNASADICPSGWRMPTGGASGEYQLLANAITGDTLDYIETEPEISNIRKALSLPLSGLFDNGLAYNQGSSGYFRSSTYYYSDGEIMYSLNVGTSLVFPQDYDYRDYGSSVRCIARQEGEL